MTSIIRCFSIALSLLLLSSCESNRLPEPSDSRKADLGQTQIKARLEQALFDQVTKAPAARLAEPVLHEWRLLSLNRIEATVDATLLRPDQLQLLKGLVWARTQAAKLGGNLGPPTHDGLKSWLYARLERLEATTASTADNPLSTAFFVGSEPINIQHFLDLIQDALITQVRLNPLQLDYQRLDSMLIKPTLLVSERAFFYQENDASIRINGALMPHLTWSDAEIIALTEGLPGQHFLAAQAHSPNWFPAHSRANRAAMSNFLLPLQSDEPYYQTAYFQTAQQHHLMLQTLMYLKAVDPDLTHSFFTARLPPSAVSSQRILQAFKRAAEDPYGLTAEAEALRKIENFVAVEPPAKGVVQRLDAAAKLRLTEIIAQLNLPVAALSL